MPKDLLQPLRLQPADPEPRGHRPGVVDLLEDLRDLVDAGDEGILGLRQDHGLLNKFGVEDPRDLPFERRHVDPPLRRDEDCAVVISPDIGDQRLRLNTVDLVEDHHGWLAVRPRAIPAFHSPREPDLRKGGG
ncbi:MAG: hypothetical protein MZV64_29630 [Ignavibacteriales bacterium]|nr:hypothetical protein [Ignavibacteriales bacterium]